MTAALLPDQIQPAATAVQFAIPQNLEEFRANEFRRRVCDRINEARKAGQPPESAIPQAALEQKAIAVAIMDPAFIALAGDELFKAKQAHGITTTTAAHEREVMQEIFSRRAAEAEAFALKLTDPKYNEELLTMAPNLVPPGDIAAQLRAAKMQETVDDLLHREPDGTPPVQAHVDAFQIGMVAEHEALANIFDPNGALHKPLMKALQDHAPQLARDANHNLTLQWLGDRQAAATATVELLKGDAYNQAISVAKAAHTPKVPAATVSDATLESPRIGKVLVNAI